MSGKKISYEIRGKPATVIAYLTSLIEGFEKKATHPHLGRGGDSPLSE